MRVQRGRRLRPVPELGHYETHVGALNSTHIGRSIAVHTGEAVVAGRLHSVYESALMGKARLVVTIWCGGTVGGLQLGLHPSHPVTVLPRDHKLTLSITPKTQDSQ